MDVSTVVANTSVEENEWKIAHHGRISLPVFKATAGLFCGIAVITLIARLGVRIVTRRRLYLDDYILIFGLLCLGAATGLLYSLCRSAFVVEAISSGAQVWIPPDQMSGQLSGLARAFFTLIWTATFFVKLSFLALFRLLIRNVSRRITVYYWIAVATTLISWIFLAINPFLLCPDVGTGKVECVRQTSRKATMAITIFMTFLDIITDAMVVSIPIIVLQKSQLKMSKKLGLAAFLCLSTVMVIMALIRVAGYRNRAGGYDLIWSFYWQFMEGCIACIMASLSSFRTLFLGGNSQTPKTPQWGPSYSMPDRFQRRMQRPQDTSWGGQDGTSPQIPSASLTGVRTMIWSSKRTTRTSSAMGSSLDPWQDEHLIGTKNRPSDHENDMFFKEPNESCQSGLPASVDQVDQNRVTRGAYMV